MYEYDILRSKNRDKISKLNLPDIELPPLKVLIWDVGYPTDIKGLVEFIPVFGPERVKTAHGTNVAQVLQTIYKAPVEFYLCVTSHRIPEAIDFCIANDIRIINASMHTFETEDKTEAIKRYVEWGGILCAAAGNDGGHPVEYPANLPYTIAVSATNDEDCDGQEIDVTADSLWWIKYAAGFYDRFSGTSCATPVISACVGVILAVHPEWQLEEIRAFLRQYSSPGDEPYERIFRFPDNFGKEGLPVPKEYIVLHHSTGVDGVTRDFDAIKKYHMETNCWRDIGYHWVIERINGILTAIPGRAEEDTAAACPGRNQDGIHVCIVGDFTSAPPDAEQYKFAADLCNDIMTRHPIKEIGGHRDYAATACPGDMFNVEIIRQLVKGVISVEDVKGRWSEEDIKLVVSQGLMKGYPDGSFKPEQAVTREELAAVLARIIRKG